jgi:hypothetical protein
MELSFDYDSRAGESVAYIGDDETALYRVRMVQDTDAECPFTSWEGNWPMLARYDRSETEYGDMPCPIASLCDGQLIKHQAAIASALDADLSAIHSDALEAQAWAKARGYQIGSMVDLKREAFDNALSDMSGSDKLQAMADLFSIAGIPCLSTCSQGYSQGQYADLLIVAPWETAKAFGWSKGKWRKLASNAADMEWQADLYGAWAWGDVYGYVCEFRASPDDEWEDLPEHGSSVWGFYGDCPHKSGLAEQAAWFTESDMRERRKARWHKLAELIRAKVPLAIRAAIIGEPEYLLA